MSSHFDLKALYTRELEQISQMALIRRFHLRNDLYDKILDDVTALDRLEYFLRPLFNREQDKIYNINKAHGIPEAGQGEEGRGGKYLFL